MLAKGRVFRFDETEVANQFAEDWTNSSNIHGIELAGSAKGEPGRVVGAGSGL